MDIRDLFGRLWDSRGKIAVGVGIATLAGFVAIFRIDLGFPPRVEQRPIETGTAISRLALDSPGSTILRATVPLESLTNRAAVFSTFLHSPPVVTRTAQLMGLRPDEIATRGAPPTGLTRGREVDADQRAAELSAEEARYRIYATSSEEAPVIAINTRAPDPQSAARLAEAATEALREYVLQASEESGVPASKGVEVRVLGSPQAGWVNRGSRYLLAGLAFVGALLAWILVLIVAARVRDSVAADLAREELSALESARMMNGRSAFVERSPVASSPPGDLGSARSGTS